MSRRPGRPPLDPAAAAVRLSVSLSPKAYDALYARATAARLTLSECVRQELRAHEPPPPQGPSGTGRREQ
jgi:hypothetical protein